MPQRLLLHTVGNRDLQFRKAMPLSLAFGTDYLQANNEAGAEDFYILKKGSGGAGRTGFREASRELGEQLKGPQQAELRAAMAFPLIEAVVEHLLQQTDIPRLDRIILVATQQVPPHGQDTDLIGEIMTTELNQRWLDRPEIGPVRLEKVDIAPVGRGFVEILETLEQLLQYLKIETFKQVYINNSQGLPAASKALEWLGMFRGYQYLTVHAQQGVRLRTLEREEAVLLRNLAGKNGP